MAEYPLSAKSSKKLSYKKTEITNSLIERSACQSQMPELLNQNQYCHILKGERVFIQLYYQGKVIPTAYNEWISFMGGSLYKRLSSKVNIFLTNTESNDLTAILQRVRKVCSTCRVVSILWFEQCFQQKKRVPFEGFELDLEKEKDQEYKFEQDGKGELGMEKILKDIAEDIEIEYKEFFRKEGSHPFQILPKNHCVLPQNVLSGKQLDLGPNPTKKPKNKPEKPRKVNKGSSLIPSRTDTLTSPRESKSMGAQLLKKQTELASKTQQKKTKNSEEEQDIDQVQKEEPKHNRLTLDRLMSKYLGTETLNQINEQNQKVNHQEGEIQGLQTINTIAQVKKDGNNDHSQQRKESTEENTNKTYKTCISMQSQKSCIGTQRMTLSAIGSRYKNVDKQIDISPLNQIKINSQMEELKKVLGKNSPNIIFVVSNSKSIYARIQKVNELACTQNSITLRFIPFPLYWRYVLQNPGFQEIYFLIESAKIIERAYYFALTMIGSKIKLAAGKLIQKIKSYNEYIKQGHHTPKKLESGQLHRHFIGQMALMINNKPIQGKKVTILSSDLPYQLHKRIIQGLGGKFIPNEQYLLGQETDILVTNRFGLKQKAKQSYQQIDLWKNVFKLQGVIDQ